MVKTSRIFAAVLLTSAFALSACSSWKKHSNESAPSATAATTTEGNSAMDHGGMMKMDAAAMKEMMQQCKTENKKAKACMHEMMKKCQASADKKECKKMMKEAKAEQKAEKKNK